MLQGSSCSEVSGNTTLSISFRWSVTNSTVQLQIFSNSILIGICPVTFLCGGLVLVDFGFAAFFNIILTVFLQNPVTMRGYGFTPAQNAECKLRPKYPQPFSGLLTATQFSSASGLVLLLLNYTGILQTTASPFGSATATAAFGSLNIDYTLSGYQVSSFFPLLSACMVPPCSTTCTTWSSRSLVSWADSRRTLSFLSRSLMSLNVSRDTHRRPLQLWGCTDCRLV